MHSRVLIVFLTGIGDISVYDGQAVSVVIINTSLLITMVSFADEEVKRDSSLASWPFLYKDFSPW